MQAHAGTPAYMAPELLAPGKPYSSKVDVYAFGVMLNEMLCRSPPWAGMAAADIKRQVSTAIDVLGSSGGRLLPSRAWPLNE